MPLHMKTEVEIDAPPPRVWAILTDVSAWSDWNPILTDLRGPMQVGQRHTLTLRAKPLPPVKIPVRLLDLEAPHRFSWRGGSRLLIQGHHGFRLEELEGDRTRVHHFETFYGALPRLLGSVMRAKLMPGYEALNRALKRRAEA